MAKEKGTPAVNAAEFALAKISFHLAVLQPDGAFVAEEYATLDELVARIKDLTNRDVTAFVFAGQRLKMSKPPLRHLLIDGLAPVPLFDLPSSLEEDDTGYLGVDPINMEDPPQLKTPRNAAPVSADVFDDDDDNGADIFSDVLPDPDS